MRYWLRYYEKSRLAELIDYGHSHPGNLKIATNGKNGLWHYSALTFAKAADLDLQYIPYSSGGAAMSRALASGEVDISANSPSELKPLVEAGRIKLLAIQSDSRHAIFPEIPTAVEQGIDAEFPVWRGVFTAAGTDEDMLKELSNSIKETYDSKAFQTFLDNSGMPGRFKPYDEFTEFFEAQKNMYLELQ